MEIKELLNIKNSLILLDIDGTLVSDGDFYIENDIENIVSEIKKNNQVFLCSNGDILRNKKISDILNIPLTNPLYKKPSIKCLEDLPNISNKIVVGDKYIVDGIFSVQIGARFLKVKRIVNSKDSPKVKISYFIDDFFGFFVFKFFPFLKLLRLNHLVKNFIIFAPLFFAANIFNIDMIYNTFRAFVSFSFVSSSVYVFNDIIDIDKDKIHRWKSFRPIASGLISKKAGFVLVILLILLGLILGYGLYNMYLMLSLYFVINIIYSKYIKKKNILDIILIAFLYCIRILVGGFVSGVFLSQWIILSVFFGALFITSTKRYSQLKTSTGENFGYGTDLVNFTMLFSGVLSAGTYGIWSIMEHNNPYLVYSTIFVVFVVFKMVEYTYKFPEKTESPETFVFKDVWVLSAFLLWLLLVFYIFYLI